ncbi:hypothetical protein EMIT0P100_20508 [Pseudomonas sp. IT-P100]
MLQKGLARFGQRDATGAAVQQSRLKALFEAYYLSTDVGRRNPKPFCGSRELAALGHGDEFVDTFPTILGHRRLSLYGNNVLLLS